MALAVLCLAELRVHEFNTEVKSYLSLADLAIQYLKLSKAKNPVIYKIVK